MGDTILIDIGGTIFRTSKSTLCSVDGYFAAMFRSGIWAEETTKNPIFIDRGECLSQTFSPHLIFFPFTRSDHISLDPLLLAITESYFLG
jgi:hypothetical protein